MYVLGINAHHGDSAAAILEDGVVIAAVEEERFTRIKHWAGIPINAIDYCLSYAGIEFNQLDDVAVNMDSKAHFNKKIFYTLKSKPDISFLISKFRTRLNRENLLDAIARLSSHDTTGIKLTAIEHHAAHLASAFYPSGFGSSALLSIDGFGDFSSGAMGIGHQSNIDIYSYVHFPHSLGIFYQAVTQYLGFPDYGDEYKVMGLASYGKPKYVSEMKRMVSIDSNGVYKLNLEYFKHHNESVQTRTDEGIPECGTLFSPVFEKVFGDIRKKGEQVEQRHMDIAATAQYLYENALFTMLRKLQEKTRQENLAMAGGCAMNSVANGKILDNTDFQRVYIQPAGGDAGGAMGAALAAWYINGRTSFQPVMADAYLGPEFSQEYIFSMVNDNSELKNCNVEIDQFKDSELFNVVSDALIEGAVVGWFQGRMEWGARALGNRSILADPRRADMQELLNSKIKRRESFRPFAPSILVEQVSHWFLTDDSVPFMEKVYPIKPEMQSRIPAVTHVDGTGRLQTVKQSTNPRYYSLINNFYKKTGVPIILNTSFNENEPIVCTPEQALSCFLRTNMDMLVMGNLVIKRVERE